MTTAQTTYTETELLASHPIAEPLIAGGVRCHGGFDDTGAYVSPRTLNRSPAIRAWQDARIERGAGPLLDAPLESWPAHYPNVTQARHLIQSGVREPIVSTLTRIGTVEGFGSLIRHSVIPPLAGLFDEGIDGTALAHLDRGLYEAHARDEAGYEDEGGHKQMWFAARDIAFENPATEDETALMLFRMGITTSPTSAPNPGGLRDHARAGRLWPAEVDFDLEYLVERMARLLLIEISAFHTFAWAEELLADRELVAGEGSAARLVSYIRSDEQPHVEYLKTVLSEIRDRHVIDDRGGRHAGADLIDVLWQRALSESLGSRRRAGLDVTLAEVEHALDGHPRRADILAEFHELGDVRPDGSGEWVDASSLAVF